MASKWKPKFWKPGTDDPGSSINEERASSNDDSGVSLVYNPHASLSITLQRQRLPIFKYLYESGWTSDGKKIGITQPRRVAAVTVAMRVADEKGCLIGQNVGYAVRFDNCCDSQMTKIKFMTDGILLREIMGDPLLKKYSVIMIDEAHERTLYTDIILGLLKKIKKKRKDLKVIISSATLDAECFNYFTLFGEFDVRMFKDFFDTNITTDPSKDTAAVLSVEGRSFPVDIHYTLSPVADYVKSTVDTVMGIHLQEGPGDILAFLTGQDEVESTVEILIDRARAMPKGSQYLKVLPMYSGLPHSEQMLVFQRTPHNTRKVVVATNIAEASITIDGIAYVIDCGYVKIKVYSPKTGVESLIVTEVSQASAEQRTGRAGRVRAGKAYRLYTEDCFHKLGPGMVPEMQRSNLAPVLIQLKCMGIDNVLRFDFPSRPPAQSMIRGLELLYALDAIDDSGKLVEPLGVSMAEFPLEPMIAKMLLVSGTCTLLTASGDMTLTLSYSLLQTHDSHFSYEIPAYIHVYILYIHTYIVQLTYEASLAMDLFISLSASGKFECSKEILTIAAMLQIHHVFVSPSNQKAAAERARRKFCVYEGDHLTYLNVYQAFVKHKQSSRWCQENFLNYKGLKHAVKIREQLKKLLVHFHIPILSCDGDADQVCRCIVTGFFANAARLDATGSYRTIRDNHSLYIHPNSVLYAEEQPEWVVYHQILQTSKYYMRDVTKIEPSWLYELAPHFYEYGTVRVSSFPIVRFVLN
ncbi:hypothetical protein QZH41_015258 [Actinostola sp. cb2023]|nr:hypothetical protein QZH41_015258 [Actinostola sp. cb2023]